MMVTKLNHRSVADFDGMSPEYASALFEAASALQREPEVTLRCALRGKNLAVLCDARHEAEGEAEFFQRSATALGAQVVRLRPSLGDGDAGEQVRHVGSMLGRLYDGIECIGMPPELVRRIGADAGIPVFEGISAESHPLSRLADRLPGGRSTIGNRCAAVQAVLIAALA